MTPVRILIVEDERVVGFDLRRRLGRMGHTVVGIVASGEEAIAHAHRLQPDLVLMDVRLPGPMDGIEAAQHIWIQCQIPVVFMSGYTTVETLERIWRTVPSGYLSKPFFDDQLRMALERTLETRMALKRTLETRRQRKSRKRPHP
jgi:two-component system, cell cycle sensor histidine kinase and response regulator CckA